MGKPRKILNVGLGEVGRLSLNDVSHAWNKLSEPIFDAAFKRDSRHRASSTGASQFDGNVAFAVYGKQFNIATVRPRVRLNIAHRFANRCKQRPLIREFRSPFKNGK